MMGMFDNIRCEMKLPTEEIIKEDMDFQTKDTPTQWLDNYYIRSNGQLQMDKYEGDRWEGGEKKVPSEIINVDFTGWIYFYTFLDQKNSSGWIEFKAKFFDGLCQDIKLVRLEKPKESA